MKYLVMCAIVVVVSGVVYVDRSINSMLEPRTEAVSVFSSSLVVSGSSQSWDNYKALQPVDASEDDEPQEHVLHQT